MTVKPKTACLVFFLSAPPKSGQTVVAVRPLLSKHKNNFSASQFSLIQSITAANHYFKTYRSGGAHSLILELLLVIAQVFFSLSVCVVIPMYNLILCGDSMENT